MYTQLEDNLPEANNELYS